MKRKEIIHLLLIGVAMMMLAACASSRRAVTDSHQETKDSISAIQQDSVHKSETVNDSATVKVSEDKHVSATTTESGNYEETIQEQTTETTDSSGNRQKTTHRTTHRKGSYNNQFSYDEQLQHQQQKINRMQKTIDSLAVSSKSDVGTHWAATDSLSDTQDKNTAETRKEAWQQRAEKSAFALFLIFVTALILATLNKHIGHGQEQEKKK